MSGVINDNYMSIYATTLVKGVINIHYLLNNRIKAIEEREVQKTITKGAELTNKKEAEAAKVA